MTPRSTIEPIDLLWAEVIADKRKVGEIAEQKKKDFEARGWAEEALT
jgi:hypothetical protein